MAPIRGPLEFPFPAPEPRPAPAEDLFDRPDDDDTETGDLVTEAGGLVVDAALEHEAQLRFWLRAIVPLLNLRSCETDPSSRVQLALDLMHVAACERVSRIMRADLTGDQG